MAGRESEMAGRESEMAKANPEFAKRKCEKPLHFRENRKRFRFAQPPATYLPALRADAHAQLSDLRLKLESTKKLLLFSQDSPSGFRRNLELSDIAQRRVAAHFRA